MQMKGSNLITLGAILCTDRFGSLGYENDLVYNFKEDMDFFKRNTKDKILLMGYKTYKSIPNINAMRKRVKDIVIVLKDTSVPLAAEIVREGFEVVAYTPGSTFKLKNSLSMTRLVLIGKQVLEPDEVADFMIIGGASLYNYLEDLEVETVLLTDVEAELAPKADVFFDRKQLEKFGEPTILEEHSNHQNKLTMLQYNKKATP